MDEWQQVGAQLSIHAALQAGRRAARHDVNMPK